MLHSQPYLTPNWDHLLHTVNVFFPALIHISSGHNQVCNTSALDFQCKYVIDINLILDSISYHGEKFNGIFNFHQSVTSEK